MEKKRKFAVITGAGGTLCSCIAKHLAGQGVAVALIGRGYDKLKTVGDEIDKLGGEYIIKCADVTDKERIREIAGELYSELGACDYLINGAGGNQMMAMTTLTEYDPAELSEQRPEGMRGFFDLDMDVYESVLKINTVGTVVCCQVFGEQMAMAGGGAIINFASMNTYCPLTRVPAYAMGKAAIENYTRWLANYLAPANIRVNAIAPGFFLNERSAKFLGTVEGGLTPRGEQVIGHTPMRRFGEAGDLLGCVDFLLSETGAGFITGVTIPVDGGFLTKSGV